jgi:hypothetical protein
MKPGFYEMPDREYRAFDAVNYSTIAPCLTAPLLAWHRVQTPFTGNAATRAGSQAHLAVLEPEKWAQQYIVCPPIAKRTIAFTKTKGPDGAAVWTWAIGDETATGYKTRKEAEQAAPTYDWPGNKGTGFAKLCDAKSARGRQFAGRELVTLAEQAQAFGIADAIEADPFAGDVLAKTERREFVAIWVDNIDGLDVLCKGKIDGYDGSRKMLWDLKTCKSSDPRDFSNGCRYRFPYHAQIAFYARGCRLASEQSGDELPIDFCGFVAVEREPPYLCSVLVLSDESVRRGEVLAKKALRRFVNAKQTGLWPGRCSEIVQIDP